jgi:hypothetical protein
MSQYPSLAKNHRLELLGSSHRSHKTAIHQVIAPPVLGDFHNSFHNHLLHKPRSGSAASLRTGDMDEKAKYEALHEMAEKVEYPIPPVEEFESDAISVTTLGEIDSTSTLEELERGRLIDHRAEVENRIQTFRPTRETLATCACFALNITSSVGVVFLNKQ